MASFYMPWNQRTALVDPLGDMSRNKHIGANTQLTNEKELLGELITWAYYVAYTLNRIYDADITSYFS